MTIKGHVTIRVKVASQATEGTNPKRAKLKRLPTLSTITIYENNSQHAKRVRRKATPCKRGARIHTNHCKPLTVVG